tara:strand:+ start:40436 stop:40810 length:375 start_codon:yes stop_codon:yes gene_type:complete
MTGKTIWNQLNALGRQDLWAWGVTKPQTFSEEYFQSIPHLGGLLFKVNGLLHKQKVMIRLQPNDLYHIEIGNVVKGSWVKRKNSETIENVFFDQMIDVIDSLVEGTKNKSPKEAQEIYKKHGVL